jgi:hypothetical protein
VNRFLVEFPEKRAVGGEDSFFGISFIGCLSYTRKFQRERILKCRFESESRNLFSSWGSFLHLQPQLERRFQKGVSVIIFGGVRKWKKKKRRL